MQPMRRVGPPGSFEPVSWDEAVADIGARLKRILERHGPTAYASFVGNPPVFDYASYMWMQGLQKAIGSPWKYGVNAEDAASRNVASALLYGSPVVLTVPDLWHTDLVLMVGANPLVSHGSLVSEPRIHDALRNIVARKGRVIVVDPRRSETARQFEHVAVHAGTDAWLLGSIIHILLRDNAVDRPFLSRWTRNGEALTAAVQGLTPQAAARKCGVPAVQIEALAHALASAPSAVVYGRTGTCTQRFGTLTNFFQDVINIITGNLDSRGGWLFSGGPIDFVKFAAMAGIDTYGAVRSRVSGLPDVNGLLPSRALAEDILGPGDDRVRALCTMGGNPVISSGGGGERLESALETLDLHFSLDIYQNETNKHAHYLLPAPTMYEREDIPLAFLGNMLRPSAFATPAVIPAQGQCRPEWTVLNDIAAEVGLGGAYAIAPLRWLAKVGINVKPRTLIDFILRTGPAGDLFGLRRGGLSFAKLLEEPNGVLLQSELPTGVIGSKLRTKDRLIDLAPSAIVAELRRLRACGNTVDDYPLRLVGMRATRSHNSWLHNNERLSPVASQRLQIHPVDAQRVDLLDGQQAIVTSAAGQLVVAAELTEDMFPGNVALQHGWGHDGGWRHANRLGGVNSNVLSDGDDIEPLAGMSVLNGIPVRVVKAPIRPDDPSARQARPSIAVDDVPRGQTVRKSHDTGDQ
jgi:formate dehydrogenase